MRIQLCVTLSLVVASVTSSSTCGTATDTDGDGWYTCTTESIGSICDCNDTNPLIYPGANEANSTGDDDCDGISEWGVTYTWYDAGQRFFDPIQLQASTISAIYDTIRCDFTLEGDLVDCPYQYDSTGEYCFPKQQLINRDGNLVVAGGNDVSPDPSHLCFMIIDPNTGHILLETFDIPTDRNFMTEMIQTLDGGYVISGAQDVDDSQGLASLVKIGPLGDVEWARSYGTPTLNNYRYYFDTVSETTSGDLVAFGVSCIDAPETCMRIQRTNSSGNVKWTLDGLPDQEIFLSSTSRPDQEDGVILCGKHTSQVREVVVSLDAQSNVRWQWLGANNTWCKHLNTEWDGSIITASSSYDQLTRSYLLATTHLTADGAVVWSNRPVAYHMKNSTDITTLDDGSIVITGITDDYPNEGCWNESATLLHLDTLANPPPISEIGSCSQTGI